MPRSCFGIFDETEFGHVFGQSVQSSDIKIHPAHLISV